MKNDDVMSSLTLSVPKRPRLQAKNRQGFTTVSSLGEVTGEGCSVADIQVTRRKSSLSAGNDRAQHAVAGCDRPSDSASEVTT